MSKHQELMFDEIGRIASRTPTTSTLFNSAIRGTAVYELSSVVESFSGDDFADHMKNVVPKRPPHDRVWCEWTATDLYGPFKVTMRHGIHIHKVPTINLGASLANQPSIIEACKELGDFDPSRAPFHAFGARHYLKQISIVGNGGQQGSSPILEQPELWYILFSEDWTKFAFWGYEDQKFPGMGVPRGESVILKYKQDYVQNSYLFGIWPSVMCFALLHCKNVTTETVDPPSQPRKFREKGYPPRVSYKVLKVEVPANRAVKQSGDSIAEDAGPKVRLHMVRGHFATMRHPRFKDRVGDTYWVPAHTRGDAGLGTVVKDYKPVPTKNRKNLSSTP